MNKILSVIIPAYNMEKYLQICLDSLLIKDGFESLDVLVINDGSKDRSSEIAHGYENRFPGIFRVIDKENGNYGSCINQGLKEAKGKYVKILDADDSYDTSNFEEFISFLDTNDVDLVLSDFAVTGLDREIKKVVRYDFGDQAFPCGINKVCSSTVFKNGMQMHAVTYRRQCLIGIDYQQTEGISYTDQQWIFTPMIAMQTVAYFNKYVYKYLIGRNDQTMNPQVRLRNIHHTELCALGMVRAYEQHKDSILGRPIQEYIFARLISYVKSVYVDYFINYSKTNATLLRNYDFNLKMASNDIYNLISSRDAGSAKSFNYIDYWRKSEKCPVVLIKVFSTAYKLLLRCKAMLRPKDEMAINA